MGIQTDIEWADSTCNPMAGCDGCELWNPKAGLKHCYAGTMIGRFGKGNPGLPTVFEEPQLFPGRIEVACSWPDLTGRRRPDKPWLDGLPRLIFLCDLGDPFTESLPVDWLAPYLPRIAATPHQWLLLTKRPQRMAAFFGMHLCPPNLWLGVSVTDQATADARLRHLLRIRARVRLISAEPLLGPLEIGLLGTLPRDLAPQYTLAHERLAWVIAGGESGPKARPPHPEWAAALRDECASAGVPFFWKQWGSLKPWSEMTAAERDARTGEDGSPGATHVWSDGSRGIQPTSQNPGRLAAFYPMSKKAAGATLAGREWRQMPEVPRVG